jgi:glyoxylase-like metal-dependent hydrolase (beta-lactamase superfamily II)
VSLYVRQLALGPMKNFVYLVGSTDGTETAVVDPAWDVEAILAAADEDGRVLTHALVTHCHDDHTNGLAPLLDRIGLPIIVHRDDAAELGLPASVLTRSSAGDVVDLGGLRVRCVHTPGHTPGSQCFHVDTGVGALVSGDTLFVNTCGRCDLPGGDPVQLFHSLHRVLGELPSRTLLYPGHDYGDVQVSSLGRERSSNPYLKLNGVDDFVTYRMRPSE